MCAAQTSEVNDVVADKPEVWTVVVAAGSASRFGAPKQFASLGGRRVIDRSVARAAAHSSGVVVVLPADVDLGYGEVAATPVHLVVGGATRSESVRNGLAVVPDSVAIVLVHDGARPLASDSVFRGVIAAVADGADAAVGASKPEAVAAGPGAPADGRSMKRVSLCRFSLRGLACRSCCMYEAASGATLSSSR